MQIIAAIRLSRQIQITKFKFPIKLWYLHTHFCDMSILHEQTVRNLRCKFTNAEEEEREYTQMLILMFIEHSKMDDWSFCWLRLSNN